MIRLNKELVRQIVKSYNDIVFFTNGFIINDDLTIKHSKDKLIWVFHNKKVEEIVIHHSVLNNLIVIDIRSVVKNECTDNDLSLDFNCTDVALSDDGLNIAFSIVHNVKDYNYLFVYTNHDPVTWTRKTLFKTSNFNKINHLHFINSSLLAFSIETKLEDSSNDVKTNVVIFDVEKENKMLYNIAEDDILNRFMEPFAAYLKINVSHIRQNFKDFHIKALSFIENKIVVVFRITLSLNKDEKSLTEFYICYMDVSTDHPDISFKYLLSDNKLKEKIQYQSLDKLNVIIEENIVRFMAVTTDSYALHEHNMVDFCLNQIIQNSHYVDLVNGPIKETNNVDICFKLLKKRFIDAYKSRIEFDKGICLKDELFIHHNQDRTVFAHLDLFTNIRNNRLDLFTKEIIVTDAQLDKSYCLTVHVSVGNKCSKFIDNTIQYTAMKMAPDGKHIALGAKNQDGSCNGIYLFHKLDNGIWINKLYIDTSDHAYPFAINFVDNNRIDVIVNKDIDGNMSVFNNFYIYEIGDECKKIYNFTQNDLSTSFFNSYNDKLFKHDDFLGLPNFKHHVDDIKLLDTDNFDGALSCVFSVRREMLDLDNATLIDYFAYFPIKDTKGEYNHYVVKYLTNSDFLKKKLKLSDLDSVLVFLYDDKAHFHKCAHTEPSVSILNNLSLFKGRLNKLIALNHIVDLNKSQQKDHKETEHMPQLEQETDFQTSLTETIEEPIDTVIDSAVDQTGQDFDRQYAEYAKLAFDEDTKKTPDVSFLIKPLISGIAESINDPNRQVEFSIDEITIDADCFHLAGIKYSSKKLIGD